MLGFALHATSWAQTAAPFAFLPPATESGRFYGTSLDIKRFVGALGSVNNSAYAFFRSGTSQPWQGNPLVPRYGATPQGFGRSVAVDDAARLALVGAPETSSGGGTAYLFWPIDDKMTYIHTFEPGNSGGGFGSGVALEYPRAYIGAHRANAVFAFTAGGLQSWTVSQRIDPPSGFSGTAFGHHVAVRGDVLAVASQSGGSVNSGTLHLYTRANERWSHAQDLTTPETGAADAFATYYFLGRAISLTDRWVAVGAPEATVDGVSSAGKVYLFVRTADSGRWSLAQTLQAPVPSASGRFGITVSLHGDVAAVGTNCASGCDEGAYVYRHLNGAWTLAQRLAPVEVQRGNGFGTTVSAFGEEVLVGAYGHDHGGLQDVGAAWLYPLDPPALPPSAPVVVAPADGTTLTVSGRPSQPLDVSWSASTDPNGDPVSYTWALSATADFGAPLFVSEPSPDTQTSLSYGSLDALLDGVGVRAGQSTTWHHRVVASDGTLSTPSAASRLTLVRSILTATDSPSGALPARLWVVSNPARETATLRLDLPAASLVSVVVVDVLGRVVLDQAPVRYSGGEGHRIALSTTHLRAGLYRARVEIVGESGAAVLGCGFIKAR